MKIQVWSDFVCPYCYIGKKMLELALEDFSGKDEVEIEYKAYELDPVNPSNQNLKVKKSLEQKYGLTAEQVEGMYGNLSRLADQAGLPFSMEDACHTNTRDIHRLAKFAISKGKGDAFFQAAMRAHFAEGKFNGDPSILLDLAEQVGLDKKEAQAVLSGEAYLQEVLADEALAAKMGIDGVPFFSFNGGKQTIFGADSVANFRKALEAAQA